MKTKVAIINGYESNAILPTRAHPTDTGLDITPIRHVKRIDSLTHLLGTGISIKPPKGYYVDMVPRSSISKAGVTLANSVGIIDDTYRGELMIPIKLDNPMVNFMDLLNKPLCQLVMRKLYTPEVELVDELDETVRGTGGFGSTDGKNNANKNR
jgi:dUTP pyrophosphatase